MLVVDPPGIEPGTSALRARRATTTPRAHVSLGILDKLGFGNPN